MGVLMQNDSFVGGIDSSLVNKIGTAPLNTVAQDLSGAVNELKASGGGGITDVQVDGASVVTSGVAEIDLTGKADAATTLSGYGITDAKIENGTITLGSNTITPLTSHQDISGKVDKAGDTMTGQLDIQGTAASKPLRTRGIVGSNGSGSDGELHLQYGNSTDDSILFGNTGGGHITSNGTLYSGWSGGLQLPRVSKSCNFRPGINKINVEEYQNDSANLPSAHWYHIYTSEGSDSNYACQLALGMTTDAAYYRRYNNGTWTSWQSLVNTNTTYSIATGDSNGQIKVTPSSGSAYNVSVKGLGSAAYLTANTAASNSTVVQRNSSGYVYANYFNTTCGAANPSSYTNSRALFTSDDGFIRKATAANFRTMLELGSMATINSPVPIANGGTGGTARTGSGGAVANLFGENVSSPALFLTITDSWKNCGWSTPVQVKTLLNMTAFTPVITNSEGSVSIANGGESAYTTMKTLSLLSGRMYIIFWNVEFQGGNNTGWGAGKIDTSGDTLYGDNRSFRCKLNSDNYHTVNGMCFIKTTAARTITLKACQTSGAAKTAYGKVCALALPTNIYS